MPSRRSVKKYLVIHIHLANSQMGSCHVTFHPNHMTDSKIYWPIEQQLLARARCNDKEPVTRFYFCKKKMLFTSNDVEFANLNHLKIATIVWLSIGCDFISSIFIVATFAVIFSRYLYNGCILLVDNYRKKNRNKFVIEDQ